MQALGAEILFGQLALRQKCHAEKRQPSDWIAGGTGQTIAAFPAGDWEQFLIDQGNPDGIRAGLQ